MSELNIFQRVNAVQKKVKYVQKDAQISGGGSYKAVTHDQVVSVIRAALVDNGIVVYPEQLKGEITKETKTKTGTVGFLYSGSYAIHFVNINKPEDRISACVEAHALDYGDKAPGKALTYATKAAMLKVFSLETGENDESRVNSSEPYSDSQKDTFDTLLLEGNAVSYLEFFSSLPEVTSNALYNSGEKGKKVDLKNKCQQLSKAAHTVFDDYASQIREGILGDSESVVMELVEELTPFEKRMVAGRLSSDEVDYLKAKSPK